jgi:tetratricopeptide (TPR) repeat protein
MKVKILTLAFILLGYTQIFAQAGWNFPDNEADSIQTNEKIVLYSDMMKLGNYKHSLPHLQWLLHNVPDLNESIYINGAKIFESLAETEKDPAQKRIYEDSTLLMYDLRIKYFDDEAAVMNRKAYTAYGFFKDDKSKYQELYDMYQRTFELNKNDVWDQNLLSYMDVLRRYKLTGGNISDTEVLDIYDEIMGIIDYKMAQEKNVDRLERIADNVDKLLAATIQVDCDFIQNTLGPKLHQNPDDLKLAKNIFKLAFAGKCMDIPIFLEAVKNIYEKEPNYGMAKLIGDRSYLIKDYETALKYYQEAINNTDENIKQAELYLNMANIYGIEGNKPKARQMAYQAIEQDPAKKEAYNFIGNLYFASYEDCKKGVNEVEDRAVFIAAYEMYRKAGNYDAMSKAKEQFPTMETIFTYNMEVGDPIRIDCWINESVTIQRRD